MLRLIFKDTIVYGASVFLNKVFALAIVPIYARVLSVEEFGIFDLAVTFATMLNLVSGLEILQGVSRFWNDQADWNAKKTLASTAIWFVFLTNLFLAVIFIVGSLFYKDLGFAFYIKLDFIAYGFVYAIYNFLINQFRWELKSKEYTLVVSMMTLLNLALLLVFCLVLELGLHGVLLSQILAYMVSVFLSLYLLRSTFSAVFDQKLLRAMLKFSFPLTFSALAVFFTSYSNRFALGLYFDLEVIGRLAVVMKIGGLISLLMSGVQISLTPIIYKNHLDRKARLHISRFFTWFVSVSVCVLVGLDLFSKEITGLLVGAEYAKDSHLAIIASLGILFSQMYIFAPGLPLARRTSLQFLSTLLSGSVSVILNLVLVKHLGLYGAVVAFTISNFSFFFLWGFWGQRYYSIPWQMKKIGITVFIGFLIVVGSRIASTFNYVHLFAFVYFYKFALVSTLFFILIFFVKSLPKLSRLRSSMGN